MAKIHFNRRKYGAFATFVNRSVGLFSKRAKFVFLAEKPQAPSIITSNHTTLQAPFAYELYYGEKINFWANAKLYGYKTGIKHCRDVILKVKNLRILMPLAYVLMPLVNLYYRSYRTIPVWHDLRVVESYRATVKALADGNQVVIFAETPMTPYDRYINAFQRGFAYVGYYYYKATGEALRFYPSYCDAHSRVVLVGTPTTFDPNAKLNDEAERITAYLERETSALAAILASGNNCDGDLKRKVAAADTEMYEERGE